MLKTHGPCALHALKAHVQTCLLKIFIKNYIKNFPTLFFILTLISSSKTRHPSSPQGFLSSNSLPFLRLPPVMLMTAAATTNDGGEYCVTQNHRGFPFFLSSAFSFVPATSMAASVVMERGRRWRRHTSEGRVLSSLFPFYSRVCVCVCGVKERMKSWVCGNRRSVRFPGEFPGELGG